MQRDEGHVGVFEERAEVEALSGSRCRKFIEPFSGGLWCTASQQSGDVGIEYLLRALAGVPLAVAVDVERRKFIPVPVDLRCDGSCGDDRNLVFGGLAPKKRATVCFDIAIVLMVNG